MRSATLGKPKETQGLDALTQHSLPVSEDDAYAWDRFIYRLVKAGFGDYETAASAEIVEAAVFLLMRNSKEQRIMEWLNQPSKYGRYKN